jgi:hypothetical protein
MMYDTCVFMNVLYYDFCNLNFALCNFTGCWSGGTLASQLPQRGEGSPSAFLWLCWHLQYMRLLLTEYNDIIEKTGLDAQMSLCVQICQAIESIYSVGCHQNMCSASANAKMSTQLGKPWSNPQWWSTSGCSILVLEGQYTSVFCFYLVVNCTYLVS